MGANLSYRNLGGGLIAIVTDRQLRRLEVLDNVQNGAPALAKEFVPFTTRRDCQPDRTQVFAMKAIDGECRAGLWRHGLDKHSQAFRASTVQSTENAIGYG